MIEITQTYKIDHSKITHTVSDNATNFGKAFRMYSTDPNMKSILTLCDMGNFDKINSDEPIFENESGCSDLDLKRVGVNELFSTVESNIDNDDHFFLSQHILCCAYTLNLIATNDY